MNIRKEALTLEEKTSLEDFYFDIQEDGLTKWQQYKRDNYEILDTSLDNPKNKIL